MEKYLILRLGIVIQGPLFGQLKEGKEKKGFYFNFIYLGSINLFELKLVHRDLLHLNFYMDVIASFKVADI